MRKRIGDFLVEKGVISEAQIQQILRHSQATGLRFGDAAMDAGIVTRDKLVRVFGPTYAVDFFYLEPQYFPKITQDLIPVPDLLRLGALPLGFKTEHKFFRARKVLNVGLLDPSRKDAADEAFRLAVTKLGTKEVQGVKVFLILADQFLQVMNQVYGTGDEQLRSHDPGLLDSTLSMYLEHSH